MAGLLMGLIMLLTVFGSVLAEESKPEPITFTWLMAEGNMNLGDGIHTDKVAVLQYIKDELGIEIDWVTYNNDRYNALIAAGELPDIGSVAGNGQQLIDGGQLLPLSDLLEQYDRIS